jgi:hypothetical protein
LGNSGEMDRTNTETNQDQSNRLNNGNGGVSKAANEGDSVKGKQKSPKVPAATDGDENKDDSRRGPTLISVDEKVAWRAAPVRSRLGVKVQPATARLVRVPAYPKTEWLPVDSESKLAKK